MPHNIIVQTSKSGVVTVSRYCKPLCSELRRTLFVDVKLFHHSQNKTKNIWLEPELYWMNQLKTGELQRANFGFYLNSFKFKQREIIE